VSPLSAIPPGGVDLANKHVHSQGTEAAGAQRGLASAARAVEVYADCQEISRQETEKAGIESPTNSVRAGQQTKTIPSGHRDELWVTDITEHPTREGKLFCAVVLDAWSRRVVGWSI